MVHATSYAYQLWLKLNKVGPSTVHQLNLLLGKDLVEKSVRQGIERKWLIFDCKTNLVDLHPNVGVFIDDDCCIHDQGNIHVFVNIFITI